MVAGAGRRSRAGRPRPRSITAPTMRARLGQRHSAGRDERLDQGLVPGRRWMRARNCSPEIASASARTGRDNGTNQAQPRQAAVETGEQPGHDRRPPTGSSSRSRSPGRHASGQLRARCAVDARDVHPPQQLTYRTVPRQLGVRLDVVPRHEYEGALVRPWMRQGQARIVADDAVDGDDVDVQRPWSPADLPGAVGGLFELVGAVQPTLRVGIAVDDEYGVEEIRLLDTAPGRRPVDR